MAQNDAKRNRRRFNAALVTDLENSGIKVPQRPNGKADMNALAQMQERARIGCGKRIFSAASADAMVRYFGRLQFKSYKCRRCPFWHLTTH